MAIELFNNDHWTLLLDEAQKLVRLSRSSLGFVSAEDLRRQHLLILKPLKLRDLTQFAVLIDLRDAPGRNDPAFEAALNEFRRELSELFGRTATLVRTAMGKLQVTRLSRESGVVIPVFLDESEAVRYLTYTL